MRSRILGSLLAALLTLALAPNAVYAASAPSPEPASPSVPIASSEVVDYSVVDPGSSLGTLLAALDLAKQRVVSARERVNAANLEYVAAQQEYASALQAVRSSSASLAAANSVLIAAQNDFTTTGVVLDTASSSLDNLVRQVYMTGAAPSPIDLMLVDTSGQLEGAASDLAWRTSTLDSAVYEVSAASTARMASTARLDAARAAQASAASVYESGQALVDQAYSRLNLARLATVEASAALAAATQAQGNVLVSFSPASPAKVADPLNCSNWLARLLYEVGFTGEDNREAWAIVMRESGGNELSESSSGDVGLFQLNRATYSSQSWWDEELLLDRRYNAAVAYDMSKGGRSWVQWGLDGHGRVNPLLYERAGWSEQMILDHIVAPYAKWYDLYPCTASVPPGVPSSVGLPLTPLP